MMVMLYYALIMTYCGRFKSMLYLFLVVCSGLVQLMKLVISTCFCTLAPEISVLGDFGTVLQQNGSLGSTATSHLTIYQFTFIVCSSCQEHYFHIDSHQSLVGKAYNMIVPIQVVYGLVPELVVCQRGKKFHHK
jgi:hypothetical protein